VTFWGSDLLTFTRSLILRRIVKSVLRDADRVVVVSDHMAEIAVRLDVAVGSKLTVVAGGVDVGSVGTDRDASRARLDFKEDERWIAWVGGFVADKQPAVAIDAFARVARLDPRARLFMAGDGPLRGSISALIQELGLSDRVRLAGALDRVGVMDALLASDVTVNSSASEGTPLALTESLVAGTPIAAVPVGGVPALVALVNGGTIAEHNDGHSLARAVLAELRIGRDRAALRRRASRFSLEESSLPIRSIYSELLNV
jgi:glycosyltransferase involved in cell wall biosynthesis